MTTKTKKTTHVEKKLIGWSLAIQLRPIGRDARPLLGERAGVGRPRALAADALVGARPARDHPVADALVRGDEVVAAGEGDEDLPPRSGDRVHGVER